MSNQTTTAQSVGFAPGTALQGPDSLPSFSRHRSCDGPGKAQNFRPEHESGCSIAEDFARAVCEDAKMIVGASEYPGKASPELWHYRWDTQDLKVLDIDSKFFSGNPRRYEQIRSFVLNNAWVTPIAVMKSDSGCPKFLFGPVVVRVSYANPVSGNTTEEPFKLLSAHQGAAMVALQLACEFGGIKAFEIQTHFGQPRDFISYPVSGDHGPVYRSRLAQLRPEYEVEESDDPSAVRYRIDQSPYWSPGRSPSTELDESSRLDFFKGEEFEVEQYVGHRHCPGSRSGESAPDRLCAIVKDRGLLCFRCGGKGSPKFYPYPNAGSKEEREEDRAKFDFLFAIWHAAKNFIHWSQVRFYFMPLFGFPINRLEEAEAFFPESSRAAAYEGLIRSIRYRDRLHWSADLSPVLHPNAQGIQIADVDCVFIKGVGFVRPSGERVTEKSKRKPRFVSVCVPNSPDRTGNPRGWKTLPNSDLTNSWFDKSESGIDAVRYEEGPHKGKPMGLIAVENISLVSLLPSTPKHPQRFISGTSYVPGSIPKRVPTAEAFSVFEDIRNHIPGYSTTTLELALSALAFFEARKKVCYTVITGSPGIGKSGAIRAACQAVGASSDSILNGPNAENFFSSDNQQRHIVWDYLRSQPPIIHIDECGNYHGVWSPVSDWDGVESPKVKISPKGVNPYDVAIKGPVVITGLEAVGELCGGSMSSRAIQVEVDALPVRGLGAAEDKLNRLFQHGLRGGVVGGSKAPVFDRLYTWACERAEEFAADPKLSWKKFVEDNYGGQALVPAIDSSMIFQIFELLAKRLSSQKEERSKRAPVDIESTEKYLLNRLFYSVGNSVETWTQIRKRLPKLLGVPEEYRCSFEIKSGPKARRRDAREHTLVRFALHKPYENLPPKDEDGWLDLTNYEPLYGLEGLLKCQKIQEALGKEKNDAAF